MLRSSPSDNSVHKEIENQIFPGLPRTSESLRNRLFRGFSFSQKPAELVWNLVGVGEYAAYMQRVCSNNIFLGKRRPRQHSSLRGVFSYLVYGVNERFDVEMGVDSLCECHGSGVAHNLFDSGLIHSCLSKH